VDAEQTPISPPTMSMSVWVLTVETDDAVVTHVVCPSRAQADEVRASIKSHFGHETQLDERPRGWSCGDPEHKTFRRPD